jgi:nucleoside transporter
MGMMFVQYFTLGAWVVTLAKYVGAAVEAGGLGFPATQVAGLYSTFAIGGILAPTFTGFLADRYIAAERLLALMHLLMAGLMGAVAFVCQSVAPSYAVLFALMLAYSTACMSTLTLTNVIGFRNLADPKRRFGTIRLVGTFGWIVAGFVIDLLLNPVSAGPLYLAAGASLVFSAFALVLPHTPPKGIGRPLAEVIGLPAFQLFRNRSFVVFAITAFLCNALNQFYAVFSNPYVTQIGVPRPEVVLTLGQWCEMGCMAFVPFLLHRYGLKTVMTLGLVGWVLRNGLMGTGHVPTIIALAIPLHGWSFAFFGMLGSIFVDREAPPHLRAGAQALVMILTNGPALLLGNTLAGQLVQANTVDGTVTWGPVWYVSTVGYAVATLFFVCFFRGIDRPR